MQRLCSAMLRLVVLLAVAGAADAGTSLFSPVTRVVELLQGMVTRIESDQKSEEDLYENFVCWATSITEQKEQSNAAAQSRADYLETYLNDLQNGRVELTSERVDLTKQIETLVNDFEAASQIRTKEAQDYAMAKTEMQQAIDALSKAIDVLRTATTGHEDGVLMSLKGTLAVGNAARAKEAVALNRAVHLGERVLTKGDSIFLRRLLTGEVPERASWKKLNRKATFKMDYKARSFKIQAVLAKLLETFASDLQEATNKELAAVSAFNKLMGANQQQKQANAEALARLDKEHGARGASSSEATQERDSLIQQIKDDTKYINEVQRALAEKKTQWKARQTLRAGELAALSKGISILHSDDSRDVFEKSFASQQGAALLFLQEGTSKSQVAAALALRQAAHRDSRINSIVRALNTSHFTEVVWAIDSMLEILRSEESSDLQTKEDCESDRATDTREAIKTSRDMDELTETVNALKAKVGELTAEIKDKHSQIDAIDKEVNEATTQRSKEHGEYLTSKKDDESAAAIVQQAKAVISKFYTDNNLMLTQQPFTSQAGEAPPPPPKTWDAPYGGKTAESTGIVAVLEMIHEDIQQDINKATEEENAAEQLFTETTARLGAARIALSTAISNLDGTRSVALTDITTNSEDRKTKAGNLEVVMKKIADATPGCDWYAINFHVRSSNRNIEIDGLEKAKAILSGATFDELPDPNREIKPGDALIGVRSHKFLHRQP